jgi:hypothetical protein
MGRLGEDRPSRQYYVQYAASTAAPRAHSLNLSPSRRKLKLESSRPGIISNHIFSRAKINRQARRFSFGEHKTTEQTKVLSESDVDSASESASVAQNTPHCPGQ